MQIAKKPLLKIEASADGTGKESVFLPAARLPFWRNR